MEIVKYTLAMVKSEDSIFNTDDLIEIADNFKNDKIDVVICENDEAMSARYRGVVRGTIQLTAYTVDKLPISPALIAVVAKPEYKDLGKGFILVNRNTLSIYNDSYTKFELKKNIIEDINKSIQWIENL